MKISCLQMNVRLGNVEENFLKAKNLIRTAMADNPDVIVLPETWNTGFFPKEDLPELCCYNGNTVKIEIGGLAKRYGVNIVAGSVSNVRNGKIYNTSFIFNRNGECIAEYDKTHLFTPMSENCFYSSGTNLCEFTLDGVKCGVMICYDLRFPELARSYTLDGTELVFVVSQWPKERIFHLDRLLTARAIENQMFVVCCNACGYVKDIVFGGNSAIIDPLGRTLAVGEEKEQILSAECDIKKVTEIRNEIPVLKDRNPQLYK